MRDLTMKTATFIRRLTGFAGDARLYRVDPPIEQTYPDKQTYSHVVVSTTIGSFSWSETNIFGADSEGDVLEWYQLPGSFQGELSHATALNNAGYQVAN